MKKCICIFIDNEHLTYDLLIWLKVSSLFSTASVMKDGRISLEIPSFYSKFIFFKKSNKVILGIRLLTSWTWKPRGLSDLNRHDNITGLNGLKKKLLALYILSDFPGIRKLSSLNGLISLKKLLRLMFPSTLAPK